MSTDVWDRQPYKTGFQDCPQDLVRAVAGTPEEPGIEPTWRGDNGDSLLARLEALYPENRVLEMTYRELYAKVTGRGMEILRIGGRTYTNHGDTRTEPFEAPSQEALKEPCREDIEIYKVWLLICGQNQTKTAEWFTEHGRTMKQARVHRAVEKRVKPYLAAGGILRDLDTPEAPRPEVMTMDPSKLDTGPRLRPGKPIKS